jgi:hypothetical protein
MAKRQRQPFTPRGPFVVGRGFTWNGKDLNEGSVFPHNRLAISRRRLEQLWDQRFIEVEGDYVPDEEEARAAQELAAELAAKDEADRVAAELAASTGTNNAGEGDNADDTTEDDVTETVTPVAAEGEFLYNTEEHMIEREGKEYWVADTESLIVRIYADIAKTLEASEGLTVIPADKIIEWPDTEGED